MVNVPVNAEAIWMRNIKYALKTETNPLKLTKTEREKMIKDDRKDFWKRKAKKERKIWKEINIKKI